jgi:hypothetical protein
MANFTPQQANECMVTKCESFKINGAHQYWIIEVQDNNGNIYKVINDRISGNANTIAIKSAIQAHLILTEKLPDPLPPKTITNESKDDILGDTVG